ncbi:MAG: hypothetical protein KBD63_02165 [Bacteriovoracaceae bacterium]|nr:hypothetical protein [Bacteriovoracaceae bacterium]
MLQLENITQNSFISSCEKWKRGEISDALMACIYFEALFKKENRTLRRYQKNNVLLEKNISITSSDFFKNYRVQKVRENVHLALSFWLQGAFDLFLIDYIPTAFEMLNWQIKGIRPVTMITDEKKWHEAIEHKKNVLEFFCHDLEHAYKFHADPELKKTQITFFHLLEPWTREPLVLDLYKANENFKQRVDYLMSDMNTHPIHALKYWGRLMKEFSSMRPKLSTLLEKVVFEKTTAQEDQSALELLLSIK